MPIAFITRIYHTIKSGFSIENVHTKHNRFHYSTTFDVNENHFSRFTNKY